MSEIKYGNVDIPDDAFAPDTVRRLVSEETLNALTTALREVLIPLKALQLADGHNWSPAIREQFAKAEPLALAALRAVQAKK